MTTTYQYDADGWRVLTSGGSSTVSAVRGPSGQLLSDVNGALTRDYLYAGDRLIAWAQSTGEVFDVTTDAIGSVRMVTNASQAIVERHDFLPFGEEWNPPASPVSVMKFAGKERDTETGLDYFGARYYRGNSGRFMGVDPVHGFTTIPQSWNRYAYALNNPFRYIDPDGQLWVESGNFFDPYQWVNTCESQQTCWDTVAAQVISEVWVYGSGGPGDVRKYQVLDGLVNVARIARHPDARFKSVQTPGREENYLSPAAAVALYNVAYLDSKKWGGSGLVFTGGSTAEGISALKENGKPIHLGHLGGNSIDIRYMGNNGSIQDKLAHQLGNVERNQMIIQMMADWGFGFSITGNSKTYGSTEGNSAHFDHMHVDNGK